MKGIWPVIGASIGVGGLVLTLFFNLGGNIDTLRDDVREDLAKVSEDIARIDVRLDGQGKSLSRIEVLIEAGLSPQP